MNVVKYGNTEKQRKGKSRVLLAVLGALLLTGLVAVGYTYLKLSRLDQDKIAIVEKPPAVVDVEVSTPPELEPVDGIPDDIDQDYEVEVPDPVIEPIYEQVPIKGNVVNILLMGTDVRPDEDGRGRSDTMILMSYDREKQDVRLTSFMRDIWISIPNHSWNRINAAYAFGNVGMSINTINENFKLDIQDYIVIDFEGFKRIVDEIGGIEVRLTKLEAAMINSHGYQPKLPEMDSVQLLNGAQTLSHSRNRSTGDGDFGRTRRQRDVMMAFFSKVRSDVDPIRFSSILADSLDYVRTNISPDKLFSLGMEIIRAGNLSVDQERVPFDKTWKYAREGKRSVLSIDLDRNTELLHDYLYGID